MYMAIWSWARDTMTEPKIGNLRDNRGDMMSCFWVKRLEKVGKDRKHFPASTLAAFAQDAKENDFREPAEVQTGADLDAKEGGGTGLVLDV